MNKASCSITQLEQRTKNAERIFFIVHSRAFFFIQGPLALQLELVLEQDVVAVEALSSVADALAVRVPVVVPARAESVRALRAVEVVAVQEAAEAAGVVVGVGAAGVVREGGQQGALAVALAEERFLDGIGAITLETVRGTKMKVFVALNDSG